MADRGYVWHMKNEAFLKLNREGVMPSFPADYTKVAEISPHFWPNMSPDSMYALTQNVEKAWWLYPGVKQMIRLESGHLGTRSSMVGDVVELPDGTFHRVEKVGWTEIKKS